MRRARVRLFASILVEYVLMLGGAYPALAVCASVTGLARPRVSRSALVALVAVLVLWHQLLLSKMVGSELQVAAKACG